MSREQVVKYTPERFSPGATPLPLPQERYLESAAQLELRNARGGRPGMTLLAWILWFLGFCGLVSGQLIVILLFGGLGTWCWTIGQRAQPITDPGPIPANETVATAAFSPAHRGINR